MGFVARKKEIEEFKNTFNGTLAGNFSILLINGEGGVGKTTFINKCIESIQDSGQEIFVGKSKCEEISLGDQTSYSPFIYILDYLVKKEKDQSLLLKAIKDLAPEWLPLIPIVGDLLAAVYSTGRWVGKEVFQDFQTSKTYLMQQYQNVLIKLSEAKPIILWIDNFQWADIATLELISFLASNCENLPILIICSYRSLESNIDSKRNILLNRLLNKIKIEDKGKEITLNRFTFEETKSFFKSIRHEFSEEIICRIWRESGGNPLFLKEYLKLLHDKGLIKNKGGIYKLIDSNQMLEIPTKIENIILSRVSLLESKLLNVLKYASVIGEEFSPSILCELLGIPILDLLDDLNQMEKRNDLICEEFAPEASNVKYIFNHAFVKDVIYKTLGFEQRKQIHKEISRILINKYGSQPNIHSFIIAEHHIKAGDVFGAATYYLNSCKYSLSLLAIDDALSISDELQKLLLNNKEIFKNESNLLIQNNLLKVEIAFWKGKVMEALDLCNEGKKNALQNDKYFFYYNFKYWESTIFAYTGSNEKSIDAARQVAIYLKNTKNIEDSERDTLLLKIYLRFGQKHNYFDENEIIELLKKAVSLATIYGYDSLKVEAIRYMGWIYANRFKNYKKAKNKGYEGLNIAYETNNIWGIINCHRLIAHSNRLLNNTSEALIHSRKSYMLAKNSGFPVSEQLALHSYAISIRNGNNDWHESLNLLNSCIEISRENKFHPYSGIINSLFDTALGLGKWKYAKGILDEYEYLFSNDEFPRNYLLGQLYYAKEEFIKAEEQFNKAFDQSTESISKKLIINYQIQIFRSLNCIAIGKEDLGISGVKKNLEYWIESKNSYWLGFCYYMLGWASFKKEANEQSIINLRKAISLTDNNQIYSAWPVKYLSLLLLGQVLLSENNLIMAKEIVFRCYKYFWKSQHFLLGESAYVLSKILFKLGENSAASFYFNEAINDWKRLKIKNNFWQTNEKK